jgi:hypothetical protein
MKRIIAIAALSFLGMSCETEERAINSAPENNLVGNIALTGKLMRMAQNPSAVDNFIDGSGCFAIQFPYSVVTNGEAVTLGSEADYQEVRDILDASAAGTDEVIINFPVDVTYANYTEATIATQAAFNEAIANCTGSVELSCMELTYPIGINTYNSQNQLADSFYLGSKRALFEILDNLEAYDAVTLSYPINFIAPDGTVVAIGSNQQFETAIDTYTDECLALLNPEPEPELEDIIAEGTWYVSHYFSFSDQTATYQDYDLTFNTDSTIGVTGPGPQTGTWNNTATGSIQQMGFTFTGTGLEGIEGLWTVTNFTENLIEMHRESTGIEPEKFLSLSKN